MKHTFIDTNIFLNFYAFSDEHLGKLDEIISLIERKEINLILTKQVVDEFRRNREFQLMKAEKQFNIVKSVPSVPLYYRDIPEMKKIVRHYEQIIALGKRMNEKVLTQIKKKTLKADKLMDKIMKSVNIVEVSDDVFKKAKRRVELGNPPGKKNSLGDAINWECLIEQVPERRKLYFIGADGDYISDVDDKSFSPFLSEEWNDKKKSRITLYRGLSDFIKDHFPSVKITDKEVKEEKALSHEFRYIDGSWSASEFLRNPIDVGRLGTVGTSVVTGGPINFGTSAFVSGYNVPKCTKCGREYISLVNDGLCDSCRILGPIG